MRNNCAAHCMRGRSPGLSPRAQTLPAPNTTKNKDAMNSARAARMATLSTTILPIM